nr:YigZ family protein [uncultured Blautia sp.]
MLDQYKTVLEGGTGEITEKKSRFIATVRPVSSEEEALAFLEETRKKYWDARHNCYAYSVGMNREYTRCSDDGEPSGTAGRPMLDVILGEDIYNVAVVVTRYFGGVLLGTGGLVRAYSKAVQEGFRESRIIEKKHGICLTVTTDYTGIGKIQYIAGERGIPVLDSEYTDKVVMKLLIPSEDVDSVQKAVTEGTNGRAIMEKEKELYFATVDGQVLTFETES